MIVIKPIISEKNLNNFLRMTKSTNEECQEITKEAVNQGMVYLNKNVLLEQRLKDIAAAQAAAEEEARITAAAEKMLSGDVPPEGFGTSSNAPVEDVKGEDGLTDREREYWEKIGWYQANGVPVPPGNVISDPAVAEGSNESNDQTRSSEVEPGPSVSRAASDHDGMVAPLRPGDIIHTSTVVLKGTYTVHVDDSKGVEAGMRFMLGVRPTTEIVKVLRLGVGDIVRA